MDPKLEETLLALDWHQKDFFEPISGKHIQTFEVNQSLETPNGSRNISMKLIHSNSDSYGLYLAERRVPSTLVTEKQLWQKIESKLDAHVAMEKTFQKVRNWLGLDATSGDD